MFHLGYYWWLVGITNIYQNLGDLTRSGDFTWRVSDCEELSGGLLYITFFLQDNLYTQIRYEKDMGNEEDKLLQYCYLTTHCFMVTTIVIKR